MRLGAQLYTVRDFARTPDEIRETFKKIKDIGYECVQVSGLGAIDARELAEISEKTCLPITCTHSPVPRIIGDTDALIEEHKIYGCPVIGVGYMPNEYHGTREGLEKFLSAVQPAVEKIHRAGLDFAYHNHAFEFEPLADTGEKMFDIMLERFPDWNFILDTYWVKYAGESVLDYMKKVGGERLVNIHYKDMSPEDRSICACGNGTLDFSAITALCEKLGVKNVLVEQDNANSKFNDAFGQMKISFDYLRPTIK